MPLFPPQRIAIHHSASPRSTTFEEIEAWHLARGWRAIGYNVVIDGDAKLHIGRPVPERGAAVARRNTGTISICVVGDNTEPGRRWTCSQMNRLYRHLRGLYEVWPHLQDEVYGHRNLVAPGHPTVCPGLHIAALRNLDWSVLRYWHEYG